MLRLTQERMFFWEYKSILFPYLAKYKVTFNTEVYNETFLQKEN